MTNHVILPVDVSIQLILVVWNTLDFCFHWEGGFEHFNGTKASFNVDLLDANENVFFCNKHGGIPF